MLEQGFLDLWLKRKATSPLCGWLQHFPLEIIIDVVRVDIAPNRMDDISWLTSRYQKQTNQSLFLNLSYSYTFSLLQAYLSSGISYDWIWSETLCLRTLRPGKKLHKGVEWALWACASPRLLTILNFEVQYNHLACCNRGSSSASHAPQLLILLNLKLAIFGS